MEEISKKKTEELEVTKICEEIKKEKKLFKALSLYGIYHMKKITTFYPGFKYAFFFKKFKNVFEKYYYNNSIEKFPKIINKIKVKINNDFPLIKLIDNLSLQEQEKIFIISFIITNRTVYFFLAILCIMKQKINIIFEYDDYDNISIHIISELYNISEQMKNKKDDVLHINYIKNNFTFNFSKNFDKIDFEKLNEFEIYGIHINGDKKDTKIIDIKNYLNNFNNNMIDEKLELQFKAIQIQFFEQKEINFKQTNKKNSLKEKDLAQYNEINSLKEKYLVLDNEINALKEKNLEQDNEINALKEKYLIQENEINSLKKEINELKTKFNNMKGRFIFKAFADYLFIIFNINIKLKNKIKCKQLKARINKLGCDSSYILSIIKFMKALYYNKTLYNNQTESSHYIPSIEEINNTILSLYKNDESFVFDLFQRLKPEKTIKEIMAKNNDLTKLLKSKCPSTEKKLQKNEIIEKINTIITDDEKKKSIDVIKQIINEYENNNDYDNDENDDEEEEYECDEVYDEF